MHPRVTGCKAQHCSFFTLSDAREYMRKNAGNWVEVIEGEDVQTTPVRNSHVYYAIAFGRKPGIGTKW